MDNLDFLDKAKLKKEYAHYKDSTINVDFVIAMHKIEKFKIRDDYVFTNTVIAMFDVTNNDKIPAKTIIFDLNLGIFLSNNSTKRLVNQYTKNESIDFLIVRSVMKFQGIRRNMPLITGVDTFVPLGPAVHKTVDWVSANWTNKCFLKNKKAKFETVLGFYLEFDYSGKDINKQIHDSCVLGKCFEKLLIQTCNKMGYKVSTNYEYGFLIEYDKCGCIHHEKIDQLTARKFRIIVIRMMMEKIYKSPDFTDLMNYDPKAIERLSKYLEPLKRLY